MQRQRLRSTIEQYKYLRFSYLDCFTPNAKYKLLPWLKQLGKHSIGESFEHPSVPEEHELILIHSLSDIYWANRSKKYAWAIKLIEFIEDEDKDIAA